MSSPTPGAGPPPAALLSFPKSGRTWLKLMLKFYLERVFATGDLPLDEEGRWARCDPRIPTLVVAHDGDPHFKRADELGRSRARFARHRVILLVRDPRDIMVSLYFEMTKRVGFYEEWGFDTTRVREHCEDLSRFIRGPVGRLETLLAYWKLWLDARDVPAALLLLRYEEMHEDAREALRRVVEFLGIPCCAEHLDFAVEECRFEKMRAYEKENRFRSSTLAPADPADEDSFKVRRGKVGGYREHLSSEDLEYIDRCCAELPDELACYRAGR